MAVNYIEIDTSQLSSDISSLRADITKAKASLKSMKSELEELNTMWQGAANLAFRAQTTKDYNMMLSMLGTVSKLADCMENAKSEYIKCEQSVKSAVNSIRI